jgi:hypothetical protein
MGKGRRLRKKKRKRKGVLKNLSGQIAENFQKEIRNSEIWDQMVAEFGEEKALELLKGFKADIKTSDEGP